MHHHVDNPDWPRHVTVGAANFEAVRRDKAATLAKMLDVMGSAGRQGVNLLVFPELALNTWGECEECSAESKPCAWHLAEAEPADGPSAKTIAERAREHDLHVIYGFEESDPAAPGVIYNSAALIGPNGLIGVYRKVHLGIPLETDRFTPGNELPVFDTALGPIGIQICYDFYNNPELSRIVAMKGARILVNPTGRSDLPRARENLVHATLQRAQENLLYAVSSNRVGSSHGPTWAGGSVMGGPAFPGFGRVIAEGGTGEELVVGTLDFQQLAAWYDWLPWREWRTGPQSPVNRLVADEFEKLASGTDS